MHTKSAPSHIQISGLGAKPPYKPNRKEEKTFVAHLRTVIYIVTLLIMKAKADNSSANPILGTTPEFVYKPPSPPTFPLLFFSLHTYLAPSSSLLKVELRTQV